MKKFVRVVEIIALVLALLCGGALLVGYVWFKDNTIEILNSIKDFVNQPLPIVGVSVLGIGVFTYEIVVRTNYGRKVIKQIVSDKDKALKELEEKEINLNKIKEQLENKLKEQDIELETLKCYLAQLCDLSINVKAKELAKEIMGGVDNGETKDGQTDKE